MSVVELSKICNLIQNRTSLRPILGIVCGSGLGNLTESVRNQVVIPYKDLEGFSQTTVHGHAGNFIFGHIGNKAVVLMQGRFHPYEGYTTHDCTIPIRVLHLIGVKVLIVTNAAGGLNPKYKVGDFMIIKDHISFPGLCGLSPLVGPNDPNLGKRFVPLSDAYDKIYRLLAKKIAKDLGEDDRTHEGVYAMQLGPAFETIVESRMMQMLGGDVAGMSTTHEVIVARHMDMKVFGMSLVTNECILSYESDKKVNHLEVYEVASARSAALKKFIVKLVEEIDIPSLF